MIPIEEWRGRAQSMEISGRRYACWTDNKDDQSKPWLLLIHGYPTSSWDWNFLWSTLCQHFRLAAVDMLGFGLSEKPRDVDFSIHAQADLQEAFLHRVGAKDAHILAHDYGDTVAQELLARSNEGSLSFSILSIAFLNGGLFPEQHRARAIQKLGLTPLGFVLGALMTRAGFRKTFDGIFGPNTPASDAEINAHWELINENEGRRILHKLLQYIPQRRENRERWVGALMNARIPLRLINGGADPVSGAHLYHYYREQIPNADAVLLEEIGHYPQTEAPDATAAAFFDFHSRLGTLAQ